MKTPTKEEAKRSSEALHKLRGLVRSNAISYEAAKEFGKKHATIMDAYMRSSDRKAGLSPRGFSFAAFMR